MLFSLFSLLWIAPFAIAADINNVKLTNNTESTSVTQHLYSHDANFHPDFYLSITYENLNIACEQRMSVLINGTSPGPELRLPPGKTSWIRVCNNMDDHNTTMHWHGLSQNTAPFSDGSAVSQWPIAPHRCFDYEVHPEADSAGTYFYHSHIGFQAVTAAGPLIVEDAGAPPYKYDDERILFFTDYFKKTDHEIEKGLTSTPFMWTGGANALLLNGVGISDTVQQGRDECSLPIIDVEPDKTYRLRFIGALALSMVSFGIENHTDMNVIGADGHYTKPHPVDHMQVTSGQRFDVLLKTKSADEIANMPTWYMQFETKDRPNISTNFGILRYPGIATTINSRKAQDSGGKNSPSNSNNGNSNGHSNSHGNNPNKSGHGKDIPSTKPLQLTNNTSSFLEYALEPLTPNDFPSASEVTRRIHITNQQLMKSTLIWQLDGLSWTENAPENSPPYLVDIYRNGPSAMPDYAAALANGGWDPKTLTWPVKLGEVLEIILENKGSDYPSNRGGLEFHPFHIHGGHYYDCGSGRGVYNAAENEKKLAGYNPVLRDTTNLYRYADKTSTEKTDGWRVWRLRVQDAGVWMLHCHILHHMVMGMQSVWVMGDYEQIARIPYSGAEGYLEYGGTAYGGDDISPIVWHEYD